jgi:hypothetical protein
MRLSFSGVTIFGRSGRTEDKVKVGKEYLNHDSVKLIAAISLKIGFCWSEVHGEHINTSIFFRFVKRLLNETGRNVFLIWDNVGYHRPNIIKDYLARINVPWMFIVPYVPDCNAIETWFGRVKHEYMRLKLERLTQG